MFIQSLEDEKTELKTQPPMERVREAMSLLDLLKAEQVEIAMIRTGALRELLAQGWTQRDLAKELGITHGRVGQLAAYGPGRFK